MSTIYSILKDKEQIANECRCKILALKDEYDHDVKYKTLFTLW